jgi:hypothetical protein
MQAQALLSEIQKNKSETNKNMTLTKYLEEKKRLLRPGNGEQDTTLMDCLENLRRSPSLASPSRPSPSCPSPSRPSPARPSCSGNNTTY